MRIHEGEEVTVALEILFPNTMMNGSDNAFEHAPNAFNGVSMDMPPGKLTNRMIHGVVNVSMVEIVVGAETISTDHTSLFNILSMRKIK